MPLVITVIQQKGGTGKTSITAHLGTALASQGLRVGLVDLDPQGSLTMWHKVRCKNPNYENLTPLAFQQSTQWRVSSDIRSFGKDIDVIIVDNPPHADASARQSIRLGDLILIPCQLSPVDIWATQAILEMVINEDRRCMVVLNRVPAQGKVAEGLKSELSGSPLPISAVSLGNRNAYMASFLEGLGVTEFEKNSVASVEMMKFSDEIVQTLSLQGRIKSAVSASALQSAVPEPA